MIKDRKKVLVLGVHSFLDNHVKVGIQYIAEGLADLGYLVDYISIYSSPIDIYGQQRRRRLRRIWIDRQDRHGIRIKPRLTEYAFRAFFPAHKMILRFGWQVRTFSTFVPLWFRQKQYDICIHDITANIVYLPSIQADFNILRLNDIPEGFSHRLSAHIINITRYYISSRKYDDIWTAHKPLTKYALGLNTNNRVITIPNGVDDQYLSASVDVSRLPKSAVFIGNVEKWIDLELLDKAASLLPDWKLDVIGPMSRSWNCSARNMKWLPPIPREKVPQTLARYQVGLIPFKEISGRLKYVERPLKFFEYIGAGLGVASTDVGSIRIGMGDWASYGNSPETFSEAIRYEAERAAKRTSVTCHEFIRKYCWKNVMQIINTRIGNLYFKVI